MKRPNAKNCWIVLAIAFYPLVSVAADDYENPVVLDVADVIAAEEFNTDLYTVSPEVKNDGFMNIYSVSSEFGDWEVSSTSLFKIRLSEIEGMSKMRELESDASTEQAVKDDVDEVKSGFNALVEDPEGAIKGAASGVSKMFKLSGEAWKSRHTRDESSIAGVGKTLSGYNKAWREYAGQFHVDPYSSNEALKQELDRLATAAAGGSIIGSAAKMLIPGGLGFAVSATAMSHQLNELLITSSEVELRIINRDKMLAMDVDPVIAEHYLDDPSSSPTYKTYLIGALETMEGVEGKDHYIEYAIGADSEDIALFRSMSAIGYAWYHEKTKRIKAFEKAGDFVMARDADDTLVVVAAIDHLLWTEALDLVVAQLDHASEESGGHEAKALWTTGTVSERAEDELSDRGWEINQEIAIHAD